MFDFQRCRTSVWLTGISTLAFILTGPRTHAQMVDIGTLGGTTSSSFGVSADGSVVVGSSGLAGNASDRAFRWTAAGGIQDLGTLGGSNSDVYGLSADGSIVIGTSRLAGDAIYRAFRWTQADGMQDLGTLGGNLSDARAISANGLAIVGQSSIAGTFPSRAFRWTLAGGMQNLGTLGGPSSFANAVSADGITVAGNSSIAGNVSHAFRWTAADGMQDLGTLGGTSSGAIAISADGSTVVGDSDIASNATKHAFRWTSAIGIQDLGTLGGNVSSANGVSADGSVVIGYSLISGNLISRAFRWTAASGMQDLGTLGGTSSNARAVSPDGSTVVGDSKITGDATTRAFRWKASTGLLDLGTLGGAMSTASGVSTDGSVVVGYSTTAQGEGHAFVWRQLPPTQPPEQPQNPQQPQNPEQPQTPQQPEPPRGVMIDLNNTLQQMELAAINTRLILAQRNAVTLASLHYDCPTFVGSNVCVGVRGRSTLSHNTSDLAGALVAAFRVGSRLRVGAALDYPFQENAPLGIRTESNRPRMGLFSAFEAQPGGRGFQARAAISFHQDEADLLRPGRLDNTEAGTGQAKITSLGARAEVGYGFSLGEAWVATPYLGVSHTKARRSAYQETQGAEAFPFSYGGVSQRETAAEVGLRLAGPIAPKLTVLAGAGVEIALDRRMDTIRLTSELPGFTQVSLAGGETGARLRPSGNLGLTYAIADNQRLGASVSARGQAYSSSPSATFSLRYEAGF